MRAAASASAGPTELSLLTRHLPGGGEEGHCAWGALAGVPPSPRLSPSHSARWGGAAEGPRVEPHLLKSPALSGRRNEGSAVVRREENKGVLCDAQVPEEVQDPPDAVVNLPDGVPVTAGRKERSAGAGGLRDQRAAGAEPQGGTRRGRSRQVSDGIGAEPTPPATTAEAQMLPSVHS